MKVDLVATDRALILASCAQIKKALQNAATAVRRVAHSDSNLTSDIGHLERFEKAYKAKSANAEGETGVFVGTMDIPNEQCRVLRQGVLIVVERYGGIEHGLQEDLDLNDTKLRDRLGDMKDLGMRLGGQATLFASAEAKALTNRVEAEKRALTGSLGLGSGETGTKPAAKKGGKPKLVHKKKTKADKSRVQLEKEERAKLRDRKAQTPDTPPADAPASQPFEQ